MTDQTPHPVDQVLAATTALDQAREHLNHTLERKIATWRVYQERRQQDPVTQDTDQAREAWADALTDWCAARVARERAYDELKAVLQHAKQP